MAKRTINDVDWDQGRKMGDGQIRTGFDPPTEAGLVLAEMDAGTYDAFNTVSGRRGWTDAEADLVADALRDACDVLVDETDEDAVQDAERFDGLS